MVTVNTVITTDTKESKTMVTVNTVITTDTHTISVSEKDPIKLRYAIRLMAYLESATKELTPPHSLETINDLRGRIHEVTGKLPTELKEPCPDTAQ